jgi:hypothetical protein
VPYVLVSAQCPEAISESPPASHPAQEEKDKSPQSFEFLSATDLSVKCELLFASLCVL